MRRAARLFVPAFEDWGRVGVAIASGCLLLTGLGVWPLVLAGLVEHRRARPVEWFISLRYLVARRRQTFISIISVICVVGVALGVSVITVVLSVMNGFSAMWEEKIVGARAHFSVLSREGAYPNYFDVRERVKQVPGVLGATPFLAADAILRALVLLTEPMGEEWFVRLRRTRQLHLFRVEHTTRRAHISAGGFFVPGTNGFRVHLSLCG